MANIVLNENDTEVKEKKSDTTLVIFDSDVTWQQIKQSHASFTNSGSTPP